jgi:hypothetical protein
MGVARRRAVALLVTALVAAGVGAAAVGSAHAANPWERAPTNDDYALLALANESRVAASPTLRPMRWNDQLAMAARWYSWDRKTHGCGQPVQHTSCDGETFGHRISRFFPSWSSISENIFGGSAPEAVHEGWMNSAGHRGNILAPSNVDFGGSLWLDGLAPFQVGPATEDFNLFTVPPGFDPPPVPMIPAAAVLEPGPNNPKWHVLLNYLDKNLAPSSLEVVVDGQAQPLTKSQGTLTNGSWRADIQTPATGTFCKRVFFRVTRSDGTQARWPAASDIGLGYAPGCWNLPIGSTPSPTTSSSSPPSTVATTTTTTTTAPGSVRLVTISSPANHATLKGAVKIAASATDDSKVKKLELWIDGKRVMTRSSASFTRQWLTKPKSVAAGMHTILVKAFDDAPTPNVGSASITVTVTK